MCNINSMISFETLVIHFHRATMVVSVHPVSFLNIFFFVFFFVCSFFVLLFLHHSPVLLVVQCSVFFVCEAIHYLKINELNFDSSTANWEAGKKSHYSRIVNNGNKKNESKWQKLKWVTALTRQQNIHWYLAQCENERYKTRDAIGVNEIEMKLPNSMTDL